jgi:hypothetical protein
MRDRPWLRSGIGSMAVPAAPAAPAAPLIVAALASRGESR